MPVLILKFRKTIAIGIFLLLAAALVSCASQKETQLVDDPAEHREGLVPWNKPEKWESGGNLAGMTDRR